MRIEIATDALVIISLTANVFSVADEFGARKRWSALPLFSRKVSDCAEDLNSTDADKGKKQCEEFW